MMAKLTTLKALRPALREIGFDCWTSTTGGGAGYVIGQRVDGEYQAILACGTLRDALRHGNELLAHQG